MIRVILLILMMMSFVSSSAFSNELIKIRKTNIEPFNLVQSGETFELERVNFEFLKSLKPKPTYELSLVDSLLRIDFKAPYEGTYYFQTELLPKSVTTQKQAVGFLKRSQKANLSGEYESILFNSSNAQTDLTLRLKAPKYLHVRLFADNKEVYPKIKTNDYELSLAPNSELTIKLDVLSEHYFKKTSISLSIVKAISLKKKCPIVGNSFKLILDDDGPVIYTPLFAHISIEQLEKDSNFVLDFSRFLPEDVAFDIDQTNDHITGQNAKVEYTSEQFIRYTINHNVLETGYCDELPLCVKNEEGAMRFVPAFIYVGEPVSRRSYVKLDLSEVTKHVDIKKLPSAYGLYYKPFDKPSASGVLKLRKMSLSKPSHAVDTRMLGSNVLLFKSGQFNRARKNQFTSTALLLGMRDGFVADFAGMTLHMNLKLPSVEDPHKKVDSVFNLGAVAIAGPVIDTVFITADKKFIVAQGENINFHRSESKDGNWFFPSTSVSYQLKATVEYMQTNGKRKQYSLRNASTSQKLDIPGLGIVKNGTHGCVFYHYDSILDKDYYFEFVLYNRSSYGTYPVYK